MTVAYYKNDMVFVIARGGKNTRVMYTSDTREQSFKVPNTDLTDKMDPVVQLERDQEQRVWWTFLDWADDARFTPALRLPQMAHTQLSNMESPQDLREFRFMSEQHKDVIFRAWEAFKRKAVQA